MVYAMLMVLSPILNGGLRAMSRKQIGVIVVLLTVYNIYGGYFGANYTNVNGYTLSQAIWLYVTARWLRLHADTIARVSRYWYLGAFVAITALFVLMPIIWKPVVGWLYYNSPFVFFGSLSLFLFFTQLKFRSIGINSLAPAAFGCYMLEDGLFGHMYLYRTVAAAYKGVIAEQGATAGLLAALPTCLAIVVGIWCASLVLTPFADCLSRGVNYLVGKAAKACNRLLDRVKVD